MSTLLKLITNKWFWIGLILITLLSTTIHFYKQNQQARADLEVAVTNVKAYSAQLDGVKKENRVFQFTINQLNYYNDSIIKKMNEVRLELKLKTEKIASMQYLLSQASKKDTIVLTDTIFIDPKLKVDTIIGDEWYRLQLGLEYPNKIMINPSFTSEKYIMTYTQKETIEPPKKFCIARWFQKKHTILEVKIIEKNPYIEEQESKFIEIIK